MTHTLMSDRPVMVSPGLPTPRLFDPKPPLTHLAERLSRTIGVARALARNGRRLDLTGIDDGVGMLCAKVLDLPAEDARTMLPALREMLAQVEALQAVLATPACPPDPAC